MKIEGAGGRKSAFLLSAKEKWKCLVFIRQGEYKRKDGPRALPPQS
jgi:hypothetical protein